MQINKKWLIGGGAVILAILVISGVYFGWKNWQKKHPTPVKPFETNQDDENLTLVEQNFKRETPIEPPTAETRVVGMPVVEALTKVLGGAKIIGASAVSGNKQQSFNLVVPKNLGEIDINNLVYALNDAGLTLKGREDDAKTGQISILGSALLDDKSIGWELNFTTSSNAVIVNLNQ